jgi:hypothetical protein
MSESRHAEHTEHDSTGDAHFCWCGRWGAAGYDVNVPVRVAPGEPTEYQLMPLWLCDEHRPPEAPLAEEPAPAELANVLRPPDLQKLVARYGLYNLIPDDAWAQWDAINAEWQRLRRVRFRKS